MNSLKESVPTLKFLWGSGMLCAALAMFSLFACTPAHTQTVEKIQIIPAADKKACPYPAKSGDHLCQQEKTVKTI